MAYLPAEIFKNPSLGLDYLEIIDAVQQIIPKRDPTELIPEANKARLSTYNKRSLNKELSESNIEEEIEKLHNSRALFQNIAKVKTEYGRYDTNINAMNNRFTNSKKKVIEGVGIDGSGSHPKNYFQEKTAFQIIEAGAKAYDKWESFSGEEEDIVKESIGNVIFWQSSNFAQLPIGTPVEVASAIIGLVSLTAPDPANPANYNWIDQITGGDLLRRRPECDGLKYLLEGNKLDIDDRRFDGIKAFSNQVFRRFFFTTNTSNNIYFKLGPGDGKTTSSNGSQAGVKVTTDSSNRGVFFSELKSYLEKLLYDGTTINNDDQPARAAKCSAIMLVYAVFYIYGIYITHFYDILINSISEKDIRDEYLRARQSMLQNYDKLINYAIKKKFFNSDRVLNTKIISTTSDAHKSSDTYTDNPNIPGCSASTGSTGTSNLYKLDPGKSSNAIKSIGLTSLDSDVIMGFEDSTTYINMFSDSTIIINEAFRPENYPIVFNNPHLAGTASFGDIDYRQTIERLTSFILADKKPSPPKDSDGNLITVGAPFQNNEILRATSLALSGYYQEVSASKSLYLNFMDMKINIFRSGIPAKEVMDLRDYLLNNFNLIANTMTSQLQKDAECIRLANKVLEQYKKYRREELRLTDDKTIYVAGEKRRLGEEISDFPKQLVRSMKRLHSGMEAVVRLEVAKLTFQLFLKRNPGAVLCSNFVQILTIKSAEIDKGMNDELLKLMERRIVELEKKYGQDVLKTIIKNAQLITLSSIPATPQNYLQAVSAMFTSIGAKGITGYSGGPMIIPGSTGRKMVLLEQKLRIEQRKFWEDLKTAFSGRTILLPVVKLGEGDVFNDDGFYLVDIIRSMIANRLDVFQLKPLRDKVIFGKVQQRGYIMFSGPTPDLGTPAKWRGFDYRKFKQLLTNYDGVTIFKDIRKARNIFFNILANNAIFIDNANISIPEASSTSLALVKYCSNILKKEIAKCNLIISRELFGITIQPKLEAFTATKGIDFASGTSYSEYSRLAGIGDDDIVKR